MLRHTTRARRARYSAALAATSAVCTVALLAGCAGGAGSSSGSSTTPAVAPPRVAASTQAPPQIPAPRPDGRLPDLARPVRYQLALELDPSRERFSGTTRAEITVPRPTRVIVLHGRGLTVRRATATPAGSGAAAITASATSRQGTGGRGEPEELVLVFERELPAGNATLEIGYEAPFDRSLRGLYRVRSGDAWYAFTHFEPTDARRAFPCFDEPGFKVPWEVAITAPAGQLAFTNMPEAARADNAAARTTTFRFAPTPATPSYLVAFAVGPFDVVEGARTPVPIRAITTRGQGRMTRLALEAAAAHLRILGDYFGRPYPYPKLDVVAVPEFGAGAMENPGLITFREELLLLDPEHAPTSSRRAMAGVMAHELAHQWFGDLVTMAWWNDLWLNEGFATWMTSRVVDQWQPTFNARLDALGGRSWAMEVDSLPAARAVRQPVVSTSDALEAFDGITYQKGGAVLSMLESWLGEETFRNGIREYINAHAWGNATAGDLMAALGNASHQDVAAVADTFLDQPGVPLVRVELDCPRGGAPALRVAQSRYEVIHGAGAAATTPAGDGAATSRRWRVPVCVTFEADGAPRRACTVLSEASATAPLTGATRCPRWIYPNADEAGYYRYAITPAVRSVATAATLRGLDVRMRAGFVQNAWSLVRGGELGVDEFLRLMDGFRAERSRAVLDSITGAVFGIYNDVADAELRPALAAWVGAFFRPIGRELGWDPRPGDDDDRRLMRRNVLSLLGNIARDDATLAEAERRAQAYLRDPRSVDPDIASLALPLASRRGNAARLDALLAALAHPATPADRVTLVAALGAFDDPALLRRALETSITEAVRLQDAGRVIYTAYGDPARRPAVVAWVRERFDAIRARLPEHSVGGLAGMSGGACTAEEIAAAREFWQPRVGAYEGAERALRQGVERAEQCIALRARGRDPLRTLLRVGGNGAARAGGAAGQAGGAGNGAAGTRSR